MSADHAPSFFGRGKKNSQAADAGQPTSFLGKLKQGRDEMLARAVDPWHLRLERVRGKVGDDGIERVPTQTLFDVWKCLSAAVALAPAGDWRSSCVSWGGRPSKRGA